MEPENNYWLIWLVYLLTSSLFYYGVWRLTRSQQTLWRCYSVRAVIAAIIVTPWYANAYGAALAPAWMVILLDAITIGSDATVRAGIPFIFSIIVAELIATTIYLGKLNTKYSPLKTL